jgi:hypothetical protein
MNFWGYGVFAWQRREGRKWSFFLKLASSIFTPLEFASRHHMHLVVFWIWRWNWKARTWLR